MEYLTVQREAFRFVGAELRTSVADEERDIPPFWQRFLIEDRASEIPRRSNDNLVAIYTRYEGTPGGTYSLLVGSQVSEFADLPADMATLEVPSATYAAFQITGQTSERLAETWAWVRDSELRRTFQFDLEIYGNGISGAGDLRLELLVGIETEERSESGGVLGGNPTMGVD